MCIHCSAGEHEECDCEERDNEIRVLQSEIARLVAEVERHRMTEEERKAAKCCAVRLDSVSDRGVIGQYLDRTAPREVGRE